MAAFQVQPHVTSGLEPVVESGFRQLCLSNKSRSNLGSRPGSGTHPTNFNNYLRRTQVQSGFQPCSLRTRESPLQASFQVLFEKASLDELLEVSKIATATKRPLSAALTSLKIFQPSDFSSCSQWLYEVLPTCPMGQGSRFAVEISWMSEGFLHCAGV